MKKFKLASIIILVFVVIAIVALVLIKKEKKKVAPACDTAGATTCKIDLKDASTIEATKTTIGSFGDKAKITQNIYQNDKFKFKITFTDIWKDAQVKETIPGTNSLGVIEFQLPTTDKGFENSLATALKITLYDKNNYTPSSSLEMKLAEDTNYIVTYQTWERAPLDATITEKEAADTAATFEFIK